MAKCDRCLLADLCHTQENDCEDYIPVDEREDLDRIIEERLYEFRKDWWIYTKESYE